MSGTIMQARPPGVAQRAAETGTATDTHCACGSPIRVKSTRQCASCRRRDLRRNPFKRTPEADRFMAKLAESSDGDCWLWQGHLHSAGYGLFNDADRRQVYAHRWSYEHFRAEIPEGLVLDHLCRTPACVNPWHLEPVTQKVNVHRGVSPMVRLSQEGRCSRGHDLKDAYIRPDTGRRMCRACQRERWAKAAEDPEFRRRHAEYERERKRRQRDPRPGGTL